MEDAPERHDQPADATHEPAPAIEPDPVDTVLAAWKVESLQNSPVAQHTPGWNYLVTDAIPALAQRIRADLLRRG